MSEYRPDDDLRALLENAVSDVEPAEALHVIRARTSPGGTGRRPWLWGVGGAVLATAATVAVIASLSPSGSSNTVVPPATHSPTPTPEPAPVTAPVYFVDSTYMGPRLYREDHQVPAATAVASAVETAIFDNASDPEYGSPWAGTAARVTTVTSDESGITIDLTIDSGGVGLDKQLSAKDANIAIQQAVYTAVAASQSPTDTPVHFTLDGSPVDTMFGIDVSSGVMEADPLQTESLAQITSLQEGAAITSGSIVSGVGSSFEATMGWTLMRGDTMVKQGSTMTRSDCDWMTNLCPWQFHLTGPAGTYTLVLRTDDASGMGKFFEDTKTVTITVP